MRSFIVSAVLLLFVLAGAASAQDAATTPAGDNVPTATAPSSGQPRVGLELNKLEQVEGACQIYFVVDNQSADVLGDLQTEVYLFDKEDSVLRGLLLQFKDIGAERTKVALFELAELGCEAIGRVLLNDVLVCNKEDGSPLEGCAERLAVSSRVDVAFGF